MRKIWNRPNLQVWSLSTVDSNGVGNMNICTYVTAVSMEPKLMLVAVCYHTKTLQNLETAPSKLILLQLLSAELAPVVRICGKQSGLHRDKITLLKKRYNISLEQGLPYFESAAGYVVLRPQSVIEVAGDHVVYVCSVVKQVNLAEVPLLTTDTLRALKIIR